MLLNTITWNEEKKTYEIINKIEYSEEELNKALDEIFKDKENLNNG